MKNSTMMNMKFIISKDEDTLWEVYAEPGGFYPIRGRGVWVTYFWTEDWGEEEETMVYVDDTEDDWDEIFDTLGVTSMMMPEPMRRRCIR